MTSPAPAQASATVHTHAAITIGSVVLRRAKWETARDESGRIGVAPQKGTWYGHIVRGRNKHDSIVVPMVGCPACGGALFLSHSADCAAALSLLLGIRVPVAHRIDGLGKVSPDLLCQRQGHGGGQCDFHRKVYLDRWNKTKPLYAIAYVNRAAERGRGAIEIAYSHALNAREARFHLGRGEFDVIGAGPAIGFFVDEKTGRVTVE
jgi:hypothetical protein